MPNTGRPSRDCDSCRKRRIKCDLKHPECSQCLRKGWPCPGYRKQSDVLFRTETVISFPDSQNKDRRRTQTRSTERDDSPKKQHDSDQVSKRLSRYTRRTTIGSSLTENWNNHFIPLSLTAIGTHSDSPLAIMNSMSHLLSQEKRDSPLHKAFNALACVFLAQTDHSQSAMAFRIKTYRDALTSVNGTLRDPQKCKANSTLLAIWALGVYEFFENRTDTGWHVHNQGLISLFRLRGSENYATEDGRNLFLVIFNALQIQSLRTGDESYINESILLLHDIVEHCHSSEYLPLRTCIFTYHCALLCSRIRKLLNEASDTELLASSASILQDLDNVENATYPLSHKSCITSHIVEPPLSAAYNSRSSDEDTSHPMMVDSVYRGSLRYGITWRLRVSLHVLEFLQRASAVPSCTSWQKAINKHYWLRCIEELRVLAERFSFYLGTPHEKLNSIPELISHVRTNLVPRAGPNDNLQNIVIEEP